MHRLSPGNWRSTFSSVRRPLLTLAADPRRLGAEIGVIAVLHTWNQSLTLHPHLHCVVTGGGLCPCGQWISSGDRFFLPARVLGELFRGIFLAELERRLRQGELYISVLVNAGDGQHVSDKRSTSGGWVYVVTEGLSSPIA